MKYIFNLTYWLLTLCWGYYLIQIIITDSFDLQLFYGFKTIFYAFVIQILIMIERRY